MASSQPRIAVVGGGIGGLTLAIALRDLGMDVEVFEQAPELTEIGAAVALSANGTRLLRRLGVDNALAAASAEPTELQFRRWDSGDLIWSQPMGECYRENFGAPYYGLHRVHLQNALLERVPQHVVHLGRRVIHVAQEPSGVRLTFDNGDTYDADIVVGADGIHSTLRSHVVGEARRAVYSGDIGFRGLIPVSAMPLLPNPGALQFWVGPGAHLLHYPINPDRGIVNFLAVMPRAQWNEPTWRTPCDVGEAVDAFSGWHPAVTGMVGAVEDDANWWALHDFTPLERWSRGRVVLLGDAAHAMLPHQGQGANQAIEDAVTLAHCLTAVAADDVPYAITRYEQLRRARTRNVQRYSRLAAERLHVPDGAAAVQRDRELPTLATQLSWIHHYDVQDRLGLVGSAGSTSQGASHEDREHYLQHRIEQVQPIPPARGVHVRPHDPVRRL